MENIKLLMISGDTDLYLASIGLKVIGDSFERHINYAKNLRLNSNNNSEILIITYVPHKYKKFKSKEFNKNGLIIKASYSHLRILFFFDVILFCLKNFLQKNKPNLITTQNPWGEGLIGLIFSKFFKCGFLPQLHTDITSNYWHKKNPFKRFIRLKTSIFVLKNSPIIRLVSYSLKNKLIKEFGLLEKTLKVVPVGITRSKSNKSEKELLKKNNNILPSVLFIGRFVEVKDLDLWIETAKEINQINKNIFFIMIGDGVLFKRIKNKVYELELNDNFLFTGALSTQEIQTKFSANTILLLTSHYEGFGRVIVEAMSKGIPCISTDCTGPNDIILDGESGYIIKERSAIKIAKACNNILSNEKLYKKMSDKSIFISKQNFDFDKISNKYINLMINASYTNA